MTPSNGNIFRVTGPLWGEFTDHRWIPLTRASDAELWCWSALEQNKRSSKSLRRRWFETPLPSLWRHSNEAFPCFNIWLSSISSTSIWLCVFRGEKFYSINCKYLILQYKSRRWLPIMADNYGHRNCSCFIINCFETTSTATNMPQQTAFEFCVGLNDQWWCTPLQLGTS